ISYRYQPGYSGSWRHDRRQPVRRSRHEPAATVQQNSAEVICCLALEKLWRGGLATPAALHGAGGAVPTHAPLACHSGHAQAPLRLQRGPTRPGSENLAQRTATQARAIPETDGEGISYAND